MKIEIGCLWRLIIHSMKRIICLIVLFMMPSLVWADDDEDIINVNKNDLSDNIEIAGDSSRAYGFGGLGDVDIADCIYSYQVFIVWQGTAVNPVCVADKLDVLGKHYEAAQMRCSVGRIRKVYGTEYECIQAVQFIPPPPVESPPPPEPVITQQQVEIHQEQEQQVHDSLEDRLARIEAGQRAAAREAARRREIAQKTMERLENDPEK